MPTLTCTPLLKCPFCSSKNLTLFRTEMYLGFDNVDEGEQRESVPITALFCSENHFFFVRGCDVRVSAAQVGLAS
jgi:hypothetical protein